ncbi:Helicase associated domain protein [Rossellomorea arthrocnemi]|uniref:Helicase associated domain protein n=1 Tax=Rossellomorea arthrocnemi TaxID=2769542 RepID=UPI0019192085|nr:Helicase associated domain protein [Rossellomorea arthrocnemi]
MIEKYVNQLKKLSSNKEKAKIKTLLQQVPTDKKGIVFEEFLKELYIGNGWLATRNGSKGDVGADILLCHPKTPETISIIVQAKNQARSLTYDDTKIELIKFEEKSRVKYKCNSYIMVSMEGYVKNAKKLDDFNMRLENWGYVEGLIDKYNSERKNVEPEIELLAHNKKAYDKSKELLRHSKKVAVVQATGTGKSYIIIKFLSDFIDKQCLVLAPSKYILNQLNSKFMWSLQNTKLMSYAKLARYSKSEIGSFKFDLIVLDEFHRCGAKEWGKGVQLLINNNFDALLLGTTATPVRYLDGNKDMSDKLFDGNVSTDLSLAHAIAKNILPMPTYVTALYTIDDEINKLNEKISGSDDSDKDRLLLELLEYKKNWEKSKGIPTILNKYIKNGDNKFIVFCENKKHLSNMEWLLKKWFTVARPDMRVREYRVVSGDKQSDNELNDFKLASNKNETHLLFAIDMLNEGLHIDDISGVILLRNTTSPRIFYQQIGRAIKAGNIDKKPLIFDFVNNFNNISAASFIIDLNKSKEMEREKRNKLGLGESCPEFTIFDETKEELQFFNDIELRLKNAWEYRYEQIKEFYRVNGHCMVKRNYKNKQLAYWVVTQRKLYSKGILEKERLDKLNELNFEWGAEEQWRLRFKDLLNYYEEFGTANVPKRYKVKDFGLGEWTIWLRNLYKKGKLSKEQIDLLEGIRFIWDMREFRWEEMYEELMEYKKEHGDCNVRRNANNKNAKNKELALWVSNQRKFYRQEKLSGERINKLIEIGFDFEINYRGKVAKKDNAVKSEFIDGGKEEERMKAIIEAYRQGKPLDEIRTTLNVGSGTISQVLEYKGIERRR